MNKLVNNLFMYLLPLYPLWAWFVYRFTNKPIEFISTLLMLPLALYFLIYVNKKLPRYLIFFIIFTVYHMVSVLVNDTIPENSNLVYFLLSDKNILACLFFIVIEYSVFDDKFIEKLNKFLLVVVIVSLVVSLIQIKIPAFFFNPYADEELLYVGESRNFSIYSWINLNSTGITFPILIGLLVSVYETRKPVLSILVFSGIVVSFLTRARYIMLSAIVVLMQLFFSNKRSLIKRVSMAMMLVMGILLTAVVASFFGYDVNDVINTRILEKDSDLASAKARVLSYEVFQIVFPEHPWFGVGPETRQDVIDLLGGEAPIIHVGYLSYLYFYGIVGCLFLFISVLYLLKDCWLIGRKFGFWGCFYGLVSFLLANITFVYFNFSEMGIVLLVVYLRFYKYKYDHQVKKEKNGEQNVVAMKKVGPLAGLPVR